MDGGISVALDVSLVAAVARPWYVLLLCLCMSVFSRLARLLTGLCVLDQSPQARSSK